MSGSSVYLTLAELRWIRGVSANFPESGCDNMGEKQFDRFFEKIDEAIARAAMKGHTR